MARATRLLQHLSFLVHRRASLRAGTLCAPATIAMSSRLTQTTKEGIGKQLLVVDSIGPGDACRQRMEDSLSADVRVKNAKIRMQERGSKMMAEQGIQGGHGKRRTLEQIENQAMVQDDPDELAKLFAEYREEYLKEWDRAERAVRGCGRAERSRRSDRRERQSQVMRRPMGRCRWARLRGTSAQRSSRGTMSTTSSCRSTWCRGPGPRKWGT